MDRLIITLVDDECGFMGCDYCLHGQNLSVVKFPKSSWELLLQADSLLGFISEINLSIDCLCGVCGSFCAPAKDVYCAVKSCMERTLDEEPSRLESIENLEDDFINLSSFLIEEKVFSDREIKDWDKRTFPEKRLLYEDGDLVFPESGDFPLGLKFDDVFWRLDPNCRSCSGVFSHFVQE